MKIFLESDRMLLFIKSFRDGKAYGESPEGLAVQALKLLIFILHVNLLSFPFRMFCLQVVVSFVTWTQHFLRREALVLIVRGLLYLLQDAVISILRADFILLGRWIS